MSTMCSSSLFPRTISPPARSAIFRFVVARSFAGSAAMADDSKKKTQAPFGSWKSPFTAEVVSGASLRLGGFATDANGNLLCVEGRPAEAGRCVLVKKDGNGRVEDITPSGFNVRSTVHEYGGGAFTVEGETAVFSNFSDQRLYRQSLIGERSPVPLTPAYEGPVVRYADGRFDISRGRYITVREDHRQGKEPVNDIVSVDLKSTALAEPEVLVSGNDFYAFPRLSPDGRKLAWIEWSHPNMPWDSTYLYVGDIGKDGKITKRVCVAGNDGAKEAVTEPKWSPEGELFFASDRGRGFWNLYHWVESENKCEPVYSLDAEFTRPAWIFGNSSYGFFNSSLGTRIICTYRERGNSRLAIVDISPSRSIYPVETPFDAIYNLAVSGDTLLMSAGSPKHPVSIVKMDLKNSDADPGSIIWSSEAMDLDKYQEYISVPRIIEFPTEVPGETAFVNFYPPSNGDYEAPPEEKPPLLVRSHGGPTAESDTTLQLAIQFWTSRGWAFADVNYGGSTGYGRQYRERLNGKWGIVDVGDCCSCASHLVASGEVDESRLCIDGRSAGGYTTLAALAFRDTFKAGASLYGVSDLESLMTDTHKFESRYLTSLIGDSKAFHDRSPIHYPERFSCPLILFQGLDDKVVPPNQARMIYEAVKSKGIPVALVEYEGEQHGFRKAENIKYTLEQEMLFFARLIGGFLPADKIDPVHVDNFPSK
ncbi:uncharacterized protein LOC9645741 isoform X2 [Selaginella moellendorffii]|uniref:uncharacterized protein LOC9645741 isoform X2 n=1 Tax=Selaginella moellendorffii TaxID=88036 RepID=UPI000D1C69E0|nr:uncharacterized protein LOC9645741 isoform X2 [Selaginella moellendorffii]|eukprot:XP_024522251.1 uncharacterized protein LOC9645741 isoform X2 [Selaginella moellendorffii]